MPAVLSAGLLPWYRDSEGLRVFLVHMGGPFWARKDTAAWSLAKGLAEAGEEDDLRAVARREFTEEVGVPAPAGELVDLGTVRSGAKVIRAYAVEADPALAFRESNTFGLEWPPRSGRMQEFPEADRGAWLTPEEAEERIVRSQVPFLHRLRDTLGC
ncbi:NUDIX domain-containing protein [Raineyella fluvialis]|uniref:NUDIX domain-containing protein n=1 Tax=Raineyella fluvialis TaxID=2662261 RepID=A0A5Q2F9Y6_9ACTN|nr:NUDIX domain-containing protein [Raineyella fluvialis]QGF22547.1 NUDIX domain-containing protein [Raineyella fluvialis]